MKIELSLFIGVFLGGWIVFIVILDFLSAQRIINVKKEMHLERKTCEVCAAVYFLYCPSKSKYWRCSLCGSINKEDDHRDRDSRG